jgi:hypothetical protein
MIGTDKSDLSLTISIQYIQSSSDGSEEFFFAGIRVDALQNGRPARERPSD